MKKIIVLIFLLITSVANASTFPEFSEGASGSGGGGTQISSNCDQSQFYAIGVLCQSSVNGKLYKGTGTSILEVAAGASTGDATGPSGSTDSELPLFSGTGGKTLKRSNTLSGLAFLTSGVVSMKAIGTDVQAQHASLASIAGLTESAGGFPYFTADNAWAVKAAGTAYQLLMMKSDASQPDWTSTLGATGTRLTKAWLTDLEITNYPTVNGAAVFDQDVSADANPSFGTINVVSANSLNLGTAGSAVGGIRFKNATSGYVELLPPTGALGTGQIILPASGTLATTTGSPAGFVITSQAAGDILYATSGSAWARLGKGTDDYVLTMSSSTHLPVWAAATGGAGYTNLTSFVDQTAWRVFYSDGSGDVKELALGSNGTYLKSNGASSAPTFDTPAGSGDVVDVGDCASGACLDGSSDGGTYIRLYDGTSAYTGITAGVRTLTLAPSNSNAESMVVTFGNNDNTVALSSGTGGVVNISGNAATATALAANPAACSAGNYVTDIAADGTLTCATPAGGGDMVLASAQSVTGTKTFDTTKLAVKGSSTGATAIASANASANNYTQTLKAETGDICTTGSVCSGYQASGSYLTSALPTTLTNAAATTWTAVDNNASAISIGSTGKADIIKVITTDAGEGVTMSGTLGVTGALTATLTGTATGLAGSPNITVGTISAGAAGFGVDADGDVTAKSVTTTADTTTGGYLRLSEGSNNGTDYSSITGAADAGTYPSFTFGGSQGSENLILTASSDKFTFSSSTGATLGITPATNIVGALSLGTAGSAAASLVLHNATSGGITISPITGALGTASLVIGTTFNNNKACGYTTAAGFTCDLTIGAGSGTILGTIAASANYITVSHGTADTVKDSLVSINSTTGVITTPQQTVPDLMELRPGSGATNPTYYRGFKGPAQPVTGYTAYQFPNADPTAGNVMAFGAVSSNVSAITWVDPLLKSGGTLTGHLLFTDNTYDIGASGATRPRTIYAGTSVITPALTISKSSGVAGLMTVYEANSTDTSYIGWMGAASISESYSMQFSNTQPSAGQVMAFAAPTGTGDPNGQKVSAQTWITPLVSANIDTSAELVTLVTDETGSASGTPLLVFNQSPRIDNIELGAATDTTIARSAAGIVTIEGNPIATNQVPVIDDPDNFAANFTGANLYGGTFICNAAGTAALPNATAGMSFTIVLEGTGATVIEPLATGTDDTIYLNGTALTQGHNITSSTSGAICVFQYRSADKWMATCNGFVDGT